jgi:hypothetical protein
LQGLSHGLPSFLWPEQGSARPSARDARARCGLAPPPLTKVRLPAPHRKAAAGLGRVASSHLPVATPTAAPRLRPLGRRPARRAPPHTPPRRSTTGREPNRRAPTPTPWTQPARPRERHARELRRRRRAEIRCRQ